MNILLSVVSPDNERSRSKDLKEASTDAVVGLPLLQPVSVAVARQNLRLLAMQPPICDRFTPTLGLAWPEYEV